MKLWAAAEFNKAGTRTISSAKPMLTHGWAGKWPVVVLILLVVPTVCHVKSELLLPKCSCFSACFSFFTILGSPNCSVSLDHADTEVTTVDAFCLLKDVIQPGLVVSRGLLAYLWHWPLFIPHLFPSS